MIPDPHSLPTCGTRRTGEVRRCQQRVARAHDQHRTVLKHRLLMQIGRRILAQRAQQKIDFAVAQRSGKLGIASLDDGNVGPGTGLAKPDDRLRQPAGAGQRHGADNDASPCPALPGCQFGVAGAQFGHGQTEAARPPRARRRQHETASAPVEQALAERHRKV